MSDEIKLNSRNKHPIIPRKEDKKKLISNLVAAFLNNLMISEVLSDTSSPYSKIQDWIKMLVRYAFKFASIYSTSEECEGSMILVDTTIHKKETVWRWILAGFFRLQFKWNKKELKRYFNIVPQIGRLHKKNAPPDHIYIMLIGVNPSFQKQGHARKLLDLAISRSKEEKIPLYLETFKPVNEEIYHHFGFKTLEKYPIPNSNLVVYSMLRDC